MVRDEVQFVRAHLYPDGKRHKSYQAHTIIKLSSGVGRLAVSIRHGQGHVAMNKTLIDDEHDWAGLHLKQIRRSYSRARNFGKLFPQVKRLLTTKYQSIAELNLATMWWAIWWLLGGKEVKKHVAAEEVNRLLAGNDKFRLKQVRLASESEAVNKNPDLRSSKTIVALCREVGASENYCGGTAAAAYLDFELFDKAGIAITLQDWKCREYEQLYAGKQGFVANLSIIDLLMNVDRKEAMSIMQG